MPVSAAARFLIYLFVLFLAGACVYTWRWSRTSDVARRLALAASLGLLGALVFRAWAYTYGAFGLQDALGWESFRVIAFDSRWGGRWQYQFGAAALALAGVGLIRAHRTLGWTIASVAVLGVCASLPLTGHAIASTATLVLQALHVLGASVWLGTLAVLVFMRAQDVTFRSFAPVASSGAALVVASGTVTAALYLPSLSAVWESTYGRLLGVKIAVVAGVLTCGYANWRRYRAREGRSWVRVELALAVLVMGLTGWLSGVDPP